MKRLTGSSCSKRLVASYVLDWIVIIGIAAIGGGLNFVQPYRRPFSLLDLSISFPMVKELVSTTTLVCVCLVAPAVFIAVVALLFIPGPAYCRRCNRSQILRLKLWEFEKGWAGLALSLAIAFFITQAAKNLFGKPRPDMLARCKPDLSDVASHVIGGYGQDISSRWTLVDVSICTTTNTANLNDGFRSFPSGHSSFSWSGMLYLSLFLCSKFAIAIPVLSKYTDSEDHRVVQFHEHKDDSIEHTMQNQSEVTNLTRSERKQRSIRNEAAAPPNHLLVLAAIPVAVAFWISSTRYVQFYHHGIDVFSGSLIGILSAWFAFRWYHLPVQRGRGWAWGARKEDRAFGIGVGTANYIGDTLRGSTESKDNDAARGDAMV